MTVGSGSAAGGVYDHGASGWGSVPFEASGGRRTFDDELDVVGRQLASPAPNAVGAGRVALHRPVLRAEVTVRP